MEPENWRQVKAIFDSVIELGMNERSALINSACGDDGALRREVDALLASYDAAGSFMETPFAGEIENLLSDSPADELEPGQVFNRYKIVRKIAAGGMGKVYLAQDTQLKRLVAIKLLSSDVTRDPDQLRRFVQKARFASSLNHPNIITIYEIGQADGEHFISTEFIPGETLRRRLERKPLKGSDALDIAIDVASALVVAHEANIVHRDIKPENIMLREDGYLKVLDFGLAKLGRDQNQIAGPDGDTWRSIKTLPGMIMGSVSYMSPEQARGDALDARTDIWSLGVVLYEMIVGRPPFEGASPVDVMAGILKDEPKSIKQMSNISGGLRRIVRRSLSKLPDERYQTMRDVLLELKSLRSEIETDASEPRCIAILPFTNLTRDSRVSFYEFSLADAVITELARLPAPFVYAPRLWSLSTSGE